MNTKHNVFSGFGLTALALASSLGLGGLSACDDGGTTVPDEQPPVEAPVEEPVEEARVYPDPPPPTEQRPVNFPELQMFELPNKLKVYVVENHEVPMVDVQVVVKAGTIYDDLVADMTAQMLTEGTKKRSKAKIDETIEQVGSSLGASAGLHNAFVSTRVLTPNLKLALDLVNDVVQNPKFEQEALDKLKEQQKVAIKGEKSSGASLAQRLLGKLLYPEGHPFAPDFPTDAEIDAVTPDTLRQFHTTWYQPGNAYVILSGDVTLEGVKKNVEKTLGRWVPGSEFPGHPLEKFAASDYSAALPTEMAVHIIDRNQISSDIIIGNVNGVARNSPDWLKMNAMTKLFGGGMSSRLFRDIRESKELTYNIGAFQAPQKVVGAFAIVTQTKKTDEMLTALFGHMDDIRSAEPTDQEFQAAVDNMALSFPLQIETAGQVASKVRTMLTYNLPEDYYDKYIENVRAITKADIKSMAEKNVAAVPVIVIVGKAAKIKKQLKDVEVLADAKIYEYDADLNPV